MTPQQRKEAARYLKAFDFSGLFADPSIGWDWPSSGKPLKVPSAQGFRELEVIAEKRGVKVLLVPPLANGSIMPSDERKKLEVAVTPLAAEHLLIFVDQAKTRQIWLWTSRLPGKPIRRRELNWEKGRSNELLLQKVISIAFTLDEEEALDITGVVHRLHDNLDRDRLTKRFYDEFKKHKDRFQKFISGLSDQGVMAHYTSLMLNRLMFCYFLQQKGFLDGDPHYLKNRFESVRTTLGKDKFHSFYITFLKRLFHDGLDAQARPDELTAIIGKNIPYLNGGIFAEHKIEKDNPKIQIPDEAFEKIFAFFDAYDWHLDDRPLANGNEINPEVLGYVFEKYTNQKEMGAYYTKEDITGYISKNTILPFLLQKVAAKLPAEVWDLLKNDPDRYIYEPVRRGAGADEKEWKKSLPKNIACGLGSVGVSPASSSSQDCGQDGHAPGHASFYSAEAETLTSRHKLPHWNQNDCHCLVTWRLDDSMPAELLDSWKTERDLWLTAHPKPWDETTETEFHRRFSDRIDEWLDAGYGECVLKDPKIRKIVEDALNHFDGERYHLTSYVIMPNHVHVLVRLVAEHPLAEILHSLKSFTAKAINKALNRKGTLWQAEYWDRLIRSERHLAHTLAYIRENPTKAKLKEGWSVGVSPASSISSPSTEECGRDAHAPLLERRKYWNTTAPASHALPTEIWRETIARHQRCHELRKKLRAGEVRDPADLVTLNLDIRQLTQDLIATAPADLALAMWKALRALSVLDPTCGSGAFLFAALEILEPLYEGLLERLRALLADWQSSGEKHPNWEKEIKAILAAVDRHPNEAYFIHKTIIVHNLYGVDIMEEAVEICKLRLFLKLAAQLEPGQAVEPLPDIDFNVRSGNTLVGYASRDEIRRAFTEAQGGRGGDQMALLGIENSIDDFRRIMEQAEDADRAFRRFQDLQDNIGQSAAEFRTAKETLEGILKSLRSQLDRFLAGQYDQKNLKTDATLKKWQASHEPFHWFVEFYGIMNSGGFDVIVGNPPYVEYGKVRQQYGIRPNYSTITCGNLYAFATERSHELLAPSGWCSLIVPLSLACTTRAASLREYLSRKRLWLANFDMRPGSLFEGVAQRLSIFITTNSKEPAPSHYSAGYRRWASSERASLLSTASFQQCSTGRSGDSYQKVFSSIEAGILNKMPTHKIGAVRSASGSSPVYLHRIVRYFIKALTFAPHFVDAKGEGGRSDDYKPFYFPKESIDQIAGFLNSTLFYWLWRVAGDGFHCGYGDVDSTPYLVPENSIIRKQIVDSFKKLMKELDSTSAKKGIQTKAGSIEYQEFYPRKSKPIIDSIDSAYATHYGFTPEELDFIINYDIKYRMGLGGGSAEEDEE